MSYFVRISGNIFGPFDETQLLEMKSKGKIARVTEISENERDWKAAGTFTFLYARTASTMPQSPVHELVDRFHRVNVGTRDEVPDLEQAEPEVEPEFTFEVRLNGRYVAVTKSELFELARTGGVSPEDLVTIDGTKVFADSIKGIVFGAPPPTATTPPSVIAPEAKPASFPNLGRDSTNAPDEPSLLVLSPRNRERITGELENTFQSWFSRFFTSEGRSPSLNSIILVCTLGVILLLGAGFYFVGGGWNKYGTINIEGTVTLDGEPVRGASVILHPRAENGSVAGGITKRNGKFTVTTDIVVDPTDALRGTEPMVSGALPGEYDVTFYKLKDGNREQTLGNRSVPEYEIPQKYGDIKTSGHAITIEHKGTRKFTFELTRADVGSSPAIDPFAEEALQ
jgi:hypothetical protein